jgi:hypothetical protein
MTTLNTQSLTTHDRLPADDVRKMCNTQCKILLLGVCFFCRQIFSILKMRMRYYILSVDIYNL